MKCDTAERVFLFYIWLTVAKSEFHNNVFLTGLVGIGIMVVCALIDFVIKHVIKRWIEG